MKASTMGILICAGMLTGACGVKGPLYLPDAPKDAPWPYIKPAKNASQAPAAPAASPAPVTPSGSAQSAAPGPPAGEAPDPKP